MGATGHTAAGPAAGYLYQCERALLVLAERAPVQPGLTLFMEKLDDVHLEEHGRPVDILQVKHHAGGGGSLTDESRDLWRTLNVWMSVLPELDPDEEPEFTLMTTSRAPNGSAASHLRRDEHRAPQLALERLRQIAEQSTIEGTVDVRARFSALGPFDQERLIDAIVVRDQEPEIQDLDDRLKGLLRLGVRAEHQDAFIESLKGWWYARSVALLRRTESAVTVSDLLNRIHDLRDSYHPENLPFDFDVGQPSADEHDSYATRIFIRQLQWIAATNDLLAIAIDEYHRAYTNKSRWLRLGLLRPGELDDYEQKLVVEWKRQHAFMCASLDGSATEPEKQRAGLQLWREVSDSTTVRIRPRFDEQELTRGTYHDLADRRNVGWHPAFEERLRELLASAA